MSLTQEQIQKLQPLTQHPKFGKLLQDAIEIWKKENIIPVIKDFGVIPYETDLIYIIRDKGCCLLGAALVNKPCHKAFFNTIKEYYNLSISEYDGLWVGFDIEPLFSEDFEAWKFGKQVHEIINPKLYKDVK